MLLLRPLALLAGRLAVPTLVVTLATLGSRTGVTPPDRDMARALVVDLTGPIDFRPDGVFVPETDTPKLCRLRGLRIVTFAAIAVAASETVVG